MVYFQPTNPQSIISVQTSPVLMTVDSPIGVFDSGLGGLSVLTHLTKILPNENYVYLADTLHVPYGSRSENEIKTLTLQAVNWLKQQECKLVVIACNSASAYGLQDARNDYPSLPIVGLVPALKPAVLQSVTKQVAVLATPATLNGYLLNEVIEKIANPAKVTVHKYSIASLVPWVEAGMPTKHVAVDELACLLHQLQQKMVDQLVLGCTHYPFFKDYLKNKMADLQENLQITTNIHLIDSGQAIAKRVLSLLTEQQLINQQTNCSTLKFFTTANQTITQHIASRLLYQFEPDRKLQFYQADIMSM